MALFRLLADNWFTLLQSAGIIGGLLFTGISVRRESRAKQIAKLITITRQHREIWSEHYSRPELSRVLDPNVDLNKKPVTQGEELFVGFLILHLNSAYHAMRAGMFMTPDGLRADIQRFFSLPIPRAVWGKSKLVQNDDFVAFVSGAGSGNSFHREMAARAHAGRTDTNFQPRSPSRSNAGNSKSSSSV